MTVDENYATRRWIAIAESESEPYFVVVEQNNGYYTEKDVGSPVTAFGHPIGIVSLVTNESIYALVWSKYYNEYAAYGHLLTIVRN